MNAGARAASVAVILPFLLRLLVMGVLAAGASSGCGGDHAPMPAVRDAGVHRIDAGPDAGRFDADVPPIPDADLPDAPAPRDAPPLPDTGAPDSGPIPDGGTAEWTELPGPTGPRARHVAVTLADGRVFVAGGTDGPTSLATAEIFDPATNRWSPAGMMSAGRERPTATLLPDGRIVVAGGVAGTRGSSAVDVYTPGAAGTPGTWMTAMAMPQSRSKHTATLLDDGRVLVCGGDNRAGALSSCIAYDATANTWAAAGTMPTARFDHTASRLPGGRVLLAGGRSASMGVRIATTAIWDAGMIAAGPPLTVARATHRAVELADGRVAVFGGWDVGTAGAGATEEVYDDAAGTWSPLPAFLERFDGHTATLLPDGSVAIVGGWSGLGFRADVEILDPTGTRVDTAPSLPLARAFHTTTPLPDGRLLVAGGYDMPWTVVSLAYRSRR